MAELRMAPGFSIGHASDPKLASGVTVILADAPATAGVVVQGGAPGTRETDLLNPAKTVQEVDALVLSGGSAFGLDAASGAQGWLRKNDRGFPVGPHRVPIVPAAILFDLNPTASWDRYPPYRELGWEACAAAARADKVKAPALGSVGAGTGATTGTAKGGFGMASTQLPDGVVITAVVAVNAVGSTYVGSTRHFWAAPFEEEGEYGGRGYPHPWPLNATEFMLKGSRRQENTTIGAILTNVALDQASCTQLATMAHDGFARAIYPAHTPFDGDLIFAASSGEVAASPNLPLLVLGALAGNTMARAIARGVYEAEQR
ncbi:MAG: peptidase T4 [Gammaproteobacteria bacterium]|nr:peptidase T4 [Gammaproteobacteria bacterium]